MNYIYRAVSWTASVCLLYRKMKRKTKEYTTEWFGPLAARILKPKDEMNVCQVRTQLAEKIRSVHLAHAPRGYNQPHLSAHIERSLGFVCALRTIAPEDFPNIIKLFCTKPTCPTTDGLQMIVHYLGASDTVTALPVLFEDALSKGTGTVREMARSFFSPSFMSTCRDSTIVRVLIAMFDEVYRWEAPSLRQRELQRNLLHAIPYAHVLSTWFQYGGIITPPNLLGYYAVLYGYTETVRVLLENNVMQVTDELLYLASDCGHAEMIPVLLAPATTSYTAKMLVASTYGYLEIVEQALLHGVTNIDESLVVASSRGHVPIVRRLLREVRTPETIVTALESAIVSHQHGDMILSLMTLPITRRTLRLALKHGCVPVVEHCMPQTPFLYMMELASKNGQEQLIELLLTDARRFDVDFTRVLMIACEKGHTSVVRTLLAHQGMEQEDLYRMLLTASDKGHVGIIELLLSTCDIVPTCVHYYHAVSRARLNGHSAVSQLLLNHAAQSDDILDQASRGGSMEVLVQQLAHRETSDVCRAMWIAATYGHRTLVQLLLVKVLPTPSLLLIATQYGDLADVQQIVAYYPHHLEMDRYVYAALLLACMRGQVEIVTFLHEQATRRDITEHVLLLMHTTILVQDPIVYSLMMICLDWNRERARMDPIGHYMYKDLLVAAAQHGHTAVVQFLLGAGDAQHHRFLMTACQYGHVELVHIVDPRPFFIDSLFQHACRTNQTDVVKELLRRQYVPTRRHVKIVLDKGYCNILTLVMPSMSIEDIVVLLKYTSNQPSRVLLMHTLRTFNT
jgi:ankyrin repeat protein